MFIGDLSFVRSCKLLLLLLLSIIDYYKTERNKRKIMQNDTAFYRGICCLYTLTTRDASLNI